MIDDGVTHSYGDGCPHWHGWPASEVLVHLLSDHGPDAAQLAADQPDRLGLLHARLHDDASEIGSYHEH